MPRVSKAIVAECPDCEEVSKITSSGLCMKCYKRKWQCEKKNKPYVPIKLETEPPKRGKRREMKSPNNLVHKDMNKTREIENTTTEDTTSIKDEQIKFTELSPTEFVIKDLSTRCSKLSTPIDFPKFCQTQYDLRKVVNCLSAVASVAYNDQINQLDVLLNEVERLYQHRWEASKFSEEERLKFEALLSVRRDLKEYIAGIRAIGIATSSNRSEFHSIVKAIKSQIDNFYSKYGQKEYHVEAPIFLRTETSKGEIKSNLHLYDVDIITDKYNDRHFTQSRWATGPEQAKEMVKAFIVKNHIPISFAEKDIKVTLASSKEGK